MIHNISICIGVIGIVKILIDIKQTWFNQDIIRTELIKTNKYDSYNIFEINKETNSKLFNENMFIFWDLRQKKKYNELVLDANPNDTFIKSNRYTYWRTDCVDIGNNFKKCSRTVTHNLANGNNINIADFINLPIYSDIKNNFHTIDIKKPELKNIYKLTNYILHNNFLNEIYSQHNVKYNTIFDSEFDSNFKYDLYFMEVSTLYITKLSSKYLIEHDKSKMVNHIINEIEPTTYWPVFVFSLLIFFGISKK
jgi:hypothetical protein